MELYEQAEAISTRDELVAFIRRLRTDFGATGEDWENADLPRYLEALEAWANDLPGYFGNRGEPIPEEPSWSLIAQLLLAAKYYE